MKKWYILAFALCVITSIYGQATTECSRTVLMKDDALKVPLGVCLPKGHLISNIYESCDINEDGMKDFVFKYHKYPLQDGDSIYIGIYLQKPKGVFTFFRTFSNLYPVYNKQYDWDYAPRDTALHSIHKDPPTQPKSKHPLWDLDFVNGTIAITTRFRQSANMITYYKFDKRINNWVYLRCEIVNVSDTP